MTSPGPESQADHLAPHSEIEVLRKEIESLKREQKGTFLTYAPLVVAVIALVITGLSAFIDLRALFATADLRLSPVDQLEMAYDTKTGVTFTFIFSLANLSTKDAIIQAVGGKLESLGPGPSHASFSTPSFVCHSKNQGVPIPFSANQWLGSWDCSIAIEVVSSTKALFLAPGERRLQVWFKEERGTSHEFAFCFYLMASTIRDVFDSPAATQRRFVPARCSKER